MPRRRKRRSERGAAVLSLPASGASNLSSVIASASEAIASAFAEKLRRTGRRKDDRSMGAQPEPSFRGARSANPESRDSGSGPSDHPGMTLRCVSAFSRHDAPELCSKVRPKEIEGAGATLKRARGMPGARCTRGPCAKGSVHTVVTTVAPEHPAFPHAMVLTAYGALFGDEFVLPPSSANSRSCENPVGLATPPPI